MGKNLAGIAGILIVIMALLSIDSGAWMGLIVLVIGAALLMYSANKQQPTP